MISIKDSTFYYGIGVDYLDKGDIETALRHFRKSLEIKEHFKTYERMYHCLKKLGNINEANFCIEKAYNMNLNNDKVAVLFANEMMEIGKKDLALKIINEVLKRNCTYGPAKKILDKINNN